jgi:hypothetical protein
MDGYMIRYVCWVNTTASTINAALAFSSSSAVSLNEILQLTPQFSGAAPAFGAPTLTSATGLTGGNFTALGFATGNALDEIIGPAELTTSGGKVDTLTAIEQIDGRNGGDCTLNGQLVPGT